MIRAIRPDHVLIECPSDLTPLIDGLCDPDTHPPVAAVTVRDGRAAYAPFCAHSPEYVAMLTAQETGAGLQFIDRPTSGVFDRTDGSSGPIPLGDETPFDQGDYVRALCARTGCRDGFELWDHLFESRLGQEDWQGFLNDVGIYCAGLRAATSEEDIVLRGDAEREAVMASHIAGALESGKVVVVVVGGFHAPALTSPSGRAAKVPAMQDSYLVRYSHAAMDALLGYAAGLPQPGYYDAVWRAAERANGTPDWRALAAELMQDFTDATAESGHPVSLPGKVEALRMAETLASMRDRRAVLRHDLFDGVQAALTKGEVSAREAWQDRLRRHWRGTALGSLPSGFAAPPLVEDARQRAIAHRFDVSDSLQKRRTLDIHRKPGHLAASRFLHAMHLLDTRFAKLESGPDYVTGYGAGRLHEEWTYAWSPTVESGLIELALKGMGETVSATCLAQLWALRESGLDMQLKLLGHGIRAGLEGELNPFVEAFAHDMSRSGSFAEMGRTLQQLYVLCHTRGPMRPPEGLELSRLLKVGFVRLVYLADDLPHVPADMTGEAVASLRLVADLLASDETATLDRQMFDDAVARLADKAAPPEITGAAMALALRSGQLPQDRLAAALRGSFRGAVLETEDRVGVLTGMITTAPDLLWLYPDVLRAVDEFLVSIADSDFLALLPILRRTFTQLNPREADRLAAVLAKRHAVSLASLQPTSHFTEADLASGLAAQAAMHAALREDGLFEESS